MLLLQSLGRGRREFETIRMACRCSPAALVMMFEIKSDSLEHPTPSERTDCHYYHTVCADVTVVSHERTLVEKKEIQTCLDSNKDV